MPIHAHLSRVLVAVAAAGLSACTSTPPASPVSSSPATLAGTQWQLKSIQSMDDAQGTTTPADPAAYTVLFDASGQASFKLDCNRGSTRWSATPSADGSGGQLTLGPLAMTRAMCPPGSLDTRIARDMGFVRGYRMAGSEMAMNLMADGAIYRWVPLKK